MTTHSHLPLLERLDRQGVAALAPEWDSFIASSTAAGPFMSWPWIGAWLATLGRDADLEVIAARDPGDGRLLGVAPFHVERHRRSRLSFSVLRLLGSGRAAPDHLDLPVAADAPASVAEALWQAVSDHRRWDFIDLEGLVTDGVLHRLLARRPVDAAVDQIPCPYLPLAATWEATANRFGRNHRANLGRYGRKLEREAEAPVREWMVAEHRDLEPTMAALERLHSDARESRGEVGAFSGAESAAFQREVARRMLDAGRLRLWRLDVGAEPIAAVECFRFGGTVAFYITGYDPDWARYGPGRRVIGRAIAGAVEEGATEFDFLRGDETYKTSWGTETRFDTRVRRPASSRGRMLWAGRNLVKRLRAVP